MSWEFFYDNPAYSSLGADLGLMLTLTLTTNLFCYRCFLKPGRSLTGLNLVLETTTPGE